MSGMSPQPFLLNLVVWVCFFPLHSHSSPCQLAIQRLITFVISVITKIILLKVKAMYLATLLGGIKGYTENHTHVLAFSHQWTRR